ncbi:conserved protein of unknown function [Ectopseudomonas oleovorans]|uniref:Uncharacterized protein n=1 Tax=Ectopseudomonas oleovorans TaxID=301 RepID=A0A653B4Z5_ECTOL|nr:conserved protein of unknown function [Pseudomonas oleovorans]
MTQHRQPKNKSVPFSCPLFLVRLNPRNCITT